MSMEVDVSISFIPGVVRIFSSVRFITISLLKENVNLIVRRRVEKHV